MWVNAILFQIGWFVCVFERSTVALVTAALILLTHLAINRQQRWEWFAIPLLASVGLIQDFILAQMNVLQFSTGQLPPLWLVGVWLMFVTTLNHSLKWLQQRWLLAAVLGAICGPLSYLAGERLGAVTLNQELIPVMAATWAVSLPLLLALLQLMRGPTPSCNV